MEDKKLLDTSGKDERILFPYGDNKIEMITDLPIEFMEYLVSKNYKLSDTGIEFGKGINSTKIVDQIFRFSKGEYMVTVRIDRKLSVKKMVEDTFDVTVSIQYGQMYIAADNTELVEIHFFERMMIGANPFIEAIKNKYKAAMMPQMPKKHRKR